MQTYNKSIKSDNLQRIYKIIHTTYKKSIKTYNPLQPFTTSYKRLTRRNSELSRVRVITQLAYLLTPLSQRYNFYKSGKGLDIKKLAKS